MTGRTVFLDRDGIINRKRAEGNYVKVWAEFEFLPEVKAALKLLKKHGVRVIITTNQRGVALGLMTEADLRRIHEKMLAEFAKEGISVDAVYYCPHEKGQCTCRKPQIGMFLQAKKDFPDIVFNAATVIGDSLSDMEAGARLGCRNILVADSRSAPDITEQALARGIKIHTVTRSLFEAVLNDLKVSPKPGIPG
jgi:D-glycero-D-manno-heptose 1,7-bisphosphate phosphatase